MATDTTSPLGFSDLGEPEDLREELGAMLLARSYISGPVTLSSGRTSTYYFDCKPTALHPRGALLISALFLDMLAGSDIQGVAGMTLGGDPLVSSASLLSQLLGRPLPALIVRKKAKEHGTERAVEGAANLEPGARVAVLEDVVTTGGSVLAAVESLRAAGIEIATVCAVLDREEGGREALARAGHRKPASRS
jgi:orotate phosphoribosyltransferase